MTLSRKTTEVTLSEWMRSTRRGENILEEGEVDGAEAVDAGLEVLVLWVEQGSSRHSHRARRERTLRELSYLLRGNLAETLPRCLHA